MIDYARVSKMLEYQQKGVWPLNQRRSTKTLLKDLYGSLSLSANISPRATAGKGYAVFRMGTRGWEYPWVQEQFASLKPGAKILDCGCGMSPFPEVLSSKGYLVTGLDRFIADRLSKTGYGLSHEHMRRLRGKVSFVDGDISKIPLADNSYDAVACISVMEHIVIETKGNPEAHLTCLDEMKRVLRPGGLLVCTYDTILNAEAVYGGTPEWGIDGWHYLKDIEYLNMDSPDSAAKKIDRADIINDPDAFFIPPDLYFARGYGDGFSRSAEYHRLTSVGFALIKRP